jgi:hypothetical protein
MLVGAVKFKRCVNAAEVERLFSQLLRLLQLEIKLPQPKHNDRPWPASYEDPTYSADPIMNVFPSNEDFVKMDVEARAATQAEMRANGMASVGSTLRAYFENPTGVQLKAPAPPVV